MSVDSKKIKTYKVVHKSGYSCEIDGLTKQDVIKKLKTGHYGVLPLRGSEGIVLTPDNVISIQEKGSG